MRPDLAGGAATALIGGLKLAVGELHTAVLLRPIFSCISPRSDAAVKSD